MAFVAGKLINLYVKYAKKLHLVKFDNWKHDFLFFSYKYNLEILCKDSFKFFKNTYQSLSF